MAWALMTLDTIMLDYLAWARRTRSCSTIIAWALVPRACWIITSWTFLRSAPLSLLGSVRPFFKVLAEMFLDGVRKSDFLLEPRAELLEEHLG